MRDVHGRGRSAAVHSHASERSAVGSALGLGPRGREFESLRSDSFSPLKTRRLRARPKMLARPMPARRYPGATAGRISRPRRPAALRPRGGDRNERAGRSETPRPLAPRFRRFRLGGGGVREKSDVRTKTPCPLHARTCRVFENRRAIVAQESLCRAADFAAGGRGEGRQGRTRRPTAAGPGGGGANHGRIGDGPPPARGSHTGGSSRALWSERRPTDRRPCPADLSHREKRAPVRRVLPSGRIQPHGLRIDRPPTHCLFSRSAGVAGPSAGPAGRAPGCEIPPCPDSLPQSGRPCSAGKSMAILSRSSRFAFRATGCNSL